MHFCSLYSMFSINFKVKNQCNYWKDFVFTYIYCRFFLSTWPERNWEKCSYGRNRTWPCFGLRNVPYLVTCARFFAQCTLLYENMYTVKCVKNREIAATYSSFIKCVWSPSYVDLALVKKPATKFPLIFLWHAQWFTFLSAQLVILYS
jgi:hypothetical protein